MHSKSLPHCPLALVQKSPRPAMQHAPRSIAPCVAWMVKCGSTSASHGSVAAGLQAIGAPFGQVSGGGAWLRQKPNAVFCLLFGQQTERTCMSSVVPKTLGLKCICLPQENTFPLLPSQARRPSVQTSHVHQSGRQFAVQMGGHTSIIAMLKPVVPRSSARGDAPAQVTLHDFFGACLWF